MTSSSHPDALPHELAVRGQVYVVDRAGRDDVTAIVDLLGDDDLGSAREAADDLGPYLQAFDDIAADPHQLLIVVRRATDAVVVATLQLTTVRTLSRRGATRVQVEAVRVAASERGAGLGRALFEWVAEVGRARGAVLAQLTTDRRRADAHRFYESLGWVDSHKGMKLDLARPDPT